MKIDWKKVKSLVVTYGAVTLPIATAAFAMNASGTVKLLTFLSGVLAVLARQVNPKDPFTMNLFALAQTEIQKEIEVEKAKPKKKAAPKA
jgi:Na+-transporting NADH:ubiquinone oxidoreductase subunit NqrB